MLDTGPCKQFFKDASPEECKAMYAWITGAMEVRGLIQIAGAQPTRKRRSDAGKPRAELPERMDPSELPIFNQGDGIV